MAQKVKMYKMLKIWNFQSLFNGESEAFRYWKTRWKLFSKNSSYFSMGNLRGSEARKHGGNCSLKIPVTFQWENGSKIWSENAPEFRIWTDDGVKSPIPRLGTGDRSVLLVRRLLWVRSLSLVLETGTVSGNVLALCDWNGLFKLVFAAINFIGSTPSSSSVYSSISMPSSNSITSFSSSGLPIKCFMVPPMECAEMAVPVPLRTTDCSMTSIGVMGRDRLLREGTGEVVLEIRTRC